MDSRFGLILFSTDPAFIGKAVVAGVDAIIVDWENVAKGKRQAIADTQINYDTLDDLKRVRASTDSQVICRVNNCGPATEREVEEAIEGGADEILLPMVQTIGEVEKVIDQVKGRCGVGILVETGPAVELAQELGSLPLSRAYVGLNDLAIDRGVPNIFMVLVDGTVECVRKAFRVPFGFGGLTLPDRGYPIPCRLLIGELARLRCNFSFLRRSFHQDIKGCNMAVEIPRIREALQEAFRRTPYEVTRDRRQLEEAVLAYHDGLTPATAVSIDG